MDKATGKDLDSEAYPSNETQLTKVSPVYETVPGWKDFDFASCKHWDTLPAEVHGFVTLIEDYTGIPVKYINTGAERDSIIIVG